MKLRHIFLVAALMPANAFAASKDGHEFIAFQGFTLEAASLGDVMAALGEVKPVWTGTENNDEVSVCYLAGAERL